jgi:effector-binding domain-containing protein
MKLRPVYWVILFVVVVLAWNQVFNQNAVPKTQPVFRQIPAQHVAFIHYTGSYEDMSLLFKAIAKEAKFRISGPPGSIYYPIKPRQKPVYDAYFPVKKDWIPVESSIQFKDIPTANMLVFYHVGPYPSLKSSYEKTLRFFTQTRISIKSKSREVYVKGPGWFFKGNPKKFITELQFEL